MTVKHYTTALLAGAFLALSQQGVASTTGMDFAGGCPEPMDSIAAGSLCDNGANADEANVAAILGVMESEVTEIFSGFSIDPASGTQSGDWSLDPGSLITHIAFKANGYFVLGQVTGVSGTWMLLDPVTTWGTNVSLPCPVTICSDGPRAYINADFLNNGGNIADLSNTRAFSVDGFDPPAAVPVPAAVWLFGSGLLGLVGVARRSRKA